MTIEIVDFPINSMVIFNSYVTNYQRVVMPAKSIDPIAIPMTSGHTEFLLFDPPSLPTSTLFEDLPYSVGRHWRDEITIR